MLGLAPSDSGWTAEAPAKVNLTLRVLGRRPDGYHDLESVVAAVSLYDTLQFCESDSLTLSCEGISVPDGEENLVMQAARLLAERSGPARGARIRLEKRIPPGRGFGGGSADAAAALAGLNALWGLGLAREDLAQLGSRLGSDVAFFFGAPIAVLRGRGERVEPVRVRCRWWLALAWPDFGLSTVDVYAAYDRLAVSEDKRPAATDILRALGGSAGGAGTLLVNDLEKAAQSGRLNRIAFRKVFEEAGAPAVGMTGSGSAYFALADTEGQARRLADAARAAGAEAVVVELLGR